MVNILVPTDFSRLSKVAVQYAVRIAGQLEGNITLLHVIDLQQTVRTALGMNTGIREQMKTLHDKFDKIARQVSEAMSADEIIHDAPDVRAPLKFKISHGASFSDAILRESKRLHSGLVIMGTKGASGLKKKLIGSNTASVIGSSNIPVLVVPEKAEFKPFRDVIYATDLKHLNEELKVLIPYVERFGSVVHILHIVEEGGQVDIIEARIEAAVRKTGYRNIVTLVTIDQDIDAAIENYISISGADVVAMFTHKPTFYEKMLDRSVTRKMAFHTRIPLLAFNKIESNE